MRGSHVLQSSHTTGMQDYLFQYIQTHSLQFANCPAVEDIGYYRS